MFDHEMTPLAIPSTLQDLLMARLDRLAPVKEIAQIGAAIGREFSYRLLEAVSPIQGAELQGALAQLMAADDPRARRAAGRNLCFQARARAGHSLRLTVAEPSPTHTCRHRRGVGGKVRRSGRGGSCGHRASLH